MDNLEKMDIFSEKYNFPKLNQEEIENLNRRITSMEIKTVIRNLPANKSPGPDGFIAEFYQKCKEKLKDILLKLFQKIAEMVIFQTHSMRPPSPKYKNQTKETQKKETSGQGFFNICKSISVIDHINKLKDKNHRIISVCKEKAFDKIQHPFKIKTLLKKKKNTPESRHRKNISQHNKSHI